MSLTLVPRNDADRTAYAQEVARKAERARIAREKYAADKAAGTLRKQDRKNPGTTRKGKYDPADYADEWVFLTALNVPAGEIIARSNPTQAWFVKHVMPLVHDAICTSCSGHFNPSLTRTMTKCDKACGTDHAPKHLSLCEVAGIVPERRIRERRSA